MKRFLLAVSLCIVSATARADDLQEIKQQLAQAVRDLQQRETAIKDLTRRVQALEQQRAAKPISKTSAPPPAALAATPVNKEVASKEAAPSKPAGQLTIDEVAAQQALDRVLVQQGFALLPQGSLEVEPAFTFLNLKSSFPAFIINNGTTTIVANRVKQYDYVGDLALRVGLPWDSQFDFDIPYRYLNQMTEVTQGGVGTSVSGGGNGGLGDILVGLDKGLVKEDGWKPNVIAGVQYIANSGGFSMNLPLGNNYNLLRATLNVSKAYDPLVFVGQFGFGHGFPAHGFGPGNEYDALVGAVLSVAPELSLRFELQQQFFD